MSFYEGDFRRRKTAYQDSGLESFISDELDEDIDSPTRDIKLITSSSRSKIKTKIGKVSHKWRFVNLTYSTSARKYVAVFEQLLDYKKYKKLKFKS